MDIETRYKHAVDARDKLTDNYYKWMSYYYLANAAVLVAITQFSKENQWHVNFILSIIGIFVCLLWHLSCKGYYYWSNSWINIIIRLEREIVKDNIDDGIYSVFSKTVAKKETKWDILIPNRPANISTPKLTLILSFICIYCWLTYANYSIFKSGVFGLNYFVEWLTIIGSYCLVFILPLFLRKIIRSRAKDTHRLI